MDDEKHRGASTVLWKVNREAASRDWIKNTDKAMLKDRLVVRIHRKLNAWLVIKKQ